MKNIERKSNAMKQVETKLGGDIEEVLRTLYVDHNLSINQMCKILGTSYVTTVHWLKKAGIRSRRLKVEQ